MDRVDFPVDTASEVVGLELSREVLAIVAAHVVVLDLQIAIAPETLRDHEVVGFVAARRNHRACES